MTSQHKSDCRACFPGGDQPHCRVFDTSIGAMRSFHTLFGEGRMPVMCHGNDTRYRVCFQPAARVTEAYRPKVA